MTQNLSKAPSPWRWILGMVYCVSHSSRVVRFLGRDLAGSLNMGLAKFRVALAIQMDSLGKTRVFFNNIDDGIYDEPAVIIDDSDPLLKIRLEKSQILILGFKSNKQYLSGTYLQANGNFEKEGLASPLTLRAGKDYLFPRLDSRGNPQTGYTYQAPVAVEMAGRLGIYPQKAHYFSNQVLRRFWMGPSLTSTVLLWPKVDGFWRMRHFTDILTGSHPVQSITKSVFSLLFGIARDKGLIQTNQKLFDYFPDNLFPKRWAARRRSPRARSRRRPSRCRRRRAARPRAAGPPAPARPSHAASRAGARAAARAAASPPGDGSRRDQILRPEAFQWRSRLATSAGLKWQPACSRAYTAMYSR